MKKMEKTLNKMLEYNQPTYQITKALEEMNELSMLLMQQINKEGTSKKPSIKQITDEIGDVEIRLAILKKIYGKAEVQKRVRLKIGIYKRYLKEKKYKNV